MKRLWMTLPAFLVASALWAQAETPQVRVYDHGPTSHIAGPTAPRHVIGLERMMHDITLNTGRMAYGLRYVVSKDPKDPTRAIPGEGYIGMPRPADYNWYGGGFMDLKINGKTIGDRMVQVFGGRSLGDRGYVDYVFDDPQAIVRIRFVGLAGGDCLYTQILLEPKVEIKQLSLALRCYPGGFVNGPSRHALTPTRDLPVGRATLDLEQEWWLNFYDETRDGPCSVLWVPSQAEQVSANVGTYGSETAFTLKPMLRDFRFVFFDHTGLKNADVQADLKARAAGLLQELATFQFADSALLSWSLPQKQAETGKLLAQFPDDKALVAQYDQWSRQLETQLKQVREGAAENRIVAEAEALKTIMAWDQSLPDLRLKALLRSF